MSELVLAVSEFWLDISDTPVKKIISGTWYAHARLNNFIFA